MQGDFSRLTFNARKHYRSVHMQQGRVQLDADWNEQIDIVNHYLEAQLRDIFGESGARAATAGFQIIAIDRAQQSSADSPHEPDLPNTYQERTSPLQDLLIKRGNYYVDGMLCENEQDSLFSQQPYYPGAQIPTTLSRWSIVYLDVWQRHVSALEDSSLREIALGGPETTTRTQLIWQVKWLPIVHQQSDEFLFGGNATYEEVIELPEWHEVLHRQSRKARLIARHVSNSSILDNQLYRVEIHHIHNHKATFKWSRENGSIVFGVEKILSYEKEEHGLAQSVITLSNSGQDLTRLQKGDWVEFVCDDVTLHGHTLPLYQVIRVSERAQGHVTLIGRYTQALEKLAQTHAEPLLIRRWDHAQTSTSGQDSGTYPVTENTWIDLERGIQVFFSPGGTYNVGDYWLIPSRTFSNDIEWPREANHPLALPPHGVNHHFCPLALIHLHRDVIVTKDLRRLFAPLPVLTEQIASMRKPEEIKTEIIEQIEIVERNVLYEECSSQSDLVPGDLVTLIPGTNLEITKATRENARLIFGVVSGVAESGGQKRFRVTTYGRARCKVKGSVEAGDLLTVAEEDGYAARTGPIHEFLHAGSLVGKALETYTPQASASSDDSIIADMIDILVSLQ